MKFYSLNQFPLYTDDFSLRFFDDIHKKDAIIIMNPQDSMIVAPVLVRSRRSLDEHIEYIRENNVKKAIIAAEDIQFLVQCPSLEYLWIIPAITAVDFDYSPLYEMPKIKWMNCKTMYGLRAMYDVDEEVKVSNIDYSRIRGLKRLTIDGAKGHQNVHAAEGVVSLIFGSGFPNAKNLSGFIPGGELENFFICESPIRSLDGIEEAPKLLKLRLCYNRRLTDISALRHLRDSLVWLEIDTCGKIKDFSVLSELHNLEFLTLKGNNVIPDLSFLESLPKLKNLHLTMNVADGDLHRCMGLPYARVKNRKHYTHKDKDLPKDFTDPDKLYPFKLDD